MAPWSEHIIGVVMIKHRMVDGKLEGLQESVWSQGHRGGAHRDARGRLAGEETTDFVTAVQLLTNHDGDMAVHEKEREVATMAQTPRDNGSEAREESAWASASQHT